MESTAAPLLLLKIRSEGAKINQRRVVLVYLLYLAPISKTITRSKYDNIGYMELQQEGTQETADG